MKRKRELTIIQEITYELNLQIAIVLIASIILSNIFLIELITLFGIGIFVIGLEIIVGIAVIAIITPIAYIIHIQRL